MHLTEHIWLRIVSVAVAGKLIGGYLNSSFSEETQFENEPLPLCLIVTGREIVFLISLRKWRRFLSSVRPAGWLAG